MELADMVGSTSPNLILQHANPPNTGLSPDDATPRRVRTLSFSAVDNVSAAPGVGGFVGPNFAVARGGSAAHVTGAPGENVLILEPVADESRTAAMGTMTSPPPSSPETPALEFPVPIIPTPSMRSRQTPTPPRALPLLPGRVASLGDGVGNTSPIDGEEVDYLRLILNARVYDVAHETALTLAKNLSKKLGSTLYLKREDMQPIFSFKIRGAYNKMCQLTAEERARGVVAVSAGNHAQGVALAAQKLGVKATIVMPKFAPEIKVNNVRRLGANVLLYGDCFDDAKRECQRQAEQFQYSFIPPFDDPHVIAGQGTVGVEILRQLRSNERLDAIFVAAGGGGLLAGIAAFVKRVRPEVRLIGVNTADSTSMTTSLQRGLRTEMADVGLFSDGTSVKLIGKECFRICQQYVDDMVLVSNDELCAAIKDVYEDTRSILEPAGALSVAGCKKYLLQNPSLQDGVFVAVLSGANMNFDRLQFVAERARIGEGKEVLFSVMIPEQPGSLLSMYETLYPRVVTEMSYRFWKSERAHIYVGFELADGGAAEKEQLVQQLAAKQMVAMDISDDEMAKSHGRFLAGGRSATVADERLYRIAFPERPGALRAFLAGVNNSPASANISLFHYRNHGSDMARILLGVQLIGDRGDAFARDLERLGYSLTEETHNEVYQHFLK